MHLYLVSSSVSTSELFNIYPEETRVTIPYLESSEFSVKLRKKKCDLERLERCG